jgi:hypothetical protein
MAAGEISRALALLFSPGQVVEVRAITDEGMASGYFDSMEELAARVETVDDLPGVQGIYVTLNRVNPALLSRRANRIKMRLGKKDATTADGDIVSRQWLPVDVDPLRPSGVSSSDEEHRSAIDRAKGIADFLATEYGWPGPVLADSGNGAHLLYRIDLPNDEETHDLVKRCLEVLAAMFGDKVADIDSVNHNAARIWKLYGTLSRKGDNTAERPHRRAVVLDAPDEMITVTRDQLLRLTAALPTPPRALPSPTAQGSRTGAKPGKPTDLGRWLQDHGIGVRTDKPYQGGTLYILDECPFSGAHKDGAFAIQFPNGAIYAGCHHASCGGGEQRWSELRDRYEKWGDRRDRGPFPPPGPAPPAAPAISTLPGSEEALAVLKHSDPKRAMLRTFSLDHEGDETVAECLIMSLASRAVLNTNGLHVSITGESGKGKSHAFSTMLQQVPERFRLAGAMSNKALFYIDELQPGMAIVLDDTSLSEDMAEILKGVTTSFRRPFIYRTVNKDRRGQVCTIPERCVWWVAKVEGSGDDQVFNRMLTCWIDDTPDQDDRVLNRILEQNEALPDCGNGERPEVTMCRAMWEVLGQQRLYVVIPFARKIRFQAHENRRNPDMLLDLIKANALLRCLQRDHQELAGVKYITATRDDFNEAVRLYGLLNGTSGGQATKMTKKETDLIAVIERSAWEEFTIPMLQKETGYSNGALHKLIHGYSSRGATYTGLLEKCPAIAYTDRTVVTGDMDTGSSMRRRTNAYTFDKELFRTWQAGGAVWIDEGGDDDDNNTSALPQPFRSPSAGAEGQENEPGGDNSATARDTTHVGVSDPLSFRNPEVIEYAEAATGDTSPALCECRNAEGEDQNPPVTSQNCETESQQPGKSLPQSQKDAAGKSGFAEVAEGRLTVRAADYKKMDLPDRGPCVVCGRKEAWYTEKLTPERKSRPGSRLNARKLCKNCYRSAKVRAQNAALVLPGTFDIGRVEQKRVGLGRCTVCDLDQAIYLDRRSGTQLCEFCYQRARGEQKRGEATG